MKDAKAQLVGVTDSDSTTTSTMIQGNGETFFELRSNTTEDLLQVSLRTVTHTEKSKSNFQGWDVGS